MKLVLTFRVVLFFFCLFFCACLPMNGAEEVKPTEFLFDAIRYYEEKDYHNAAAVFKRYAGKPVPVAAPFCRKLATLGCLPLQLQPNPSSESGEEKEACKWFEAACRFHKLKTSRPKYIKEAVQEAQKDNNGPLLYLIGTIYEEGTAKINVDTDTAQRIFVEALKAGDLRAILGLKRVMNDQDFAKHSMEGVPFTKIHQAFCLMPRLQQDEGQIFSASLFLNSSCKNIFLLFSAQFGSAVSQFQWGQHHCVNESKALYWMMQSAEANHIGALNMCAYMMEHGQGTAINYERAYDYYRRAASHPDAKGFELFNLATMLQQGKGTPADCNAACGLYIKASKVDDNLSFTYKCGRMLSHMGYYKEALPLFNDVKGLSDDAAYGYACTLQKLTPSQGNVTNFVNNLSVIAAQGHFYSAHKIVELAVEDNIPSNDQMLTTYKSYLEDAILKKMNSEEETQSRNENIANAYNTLRCLCLKLPQLFVQGNTCPLDFSEKAYQLDPSSQIIQFAYAQDLRNNGQYDKALPHFLSLKEAGYACSNNLGVCYDLLGKQTPSKDDPDQLAEKALECYRQEIMENGLQRAASAFNIYSLSCQNRIARLPDEEIIQLLTLAVDGGDQDAFNDLGIAYMCGTYGLEPNLSEAESLLRKAIEQNHHPTPIVNLINLKLGKKDTKEVEKLFSELWETHPEELKNYLIGVIKDRDMIREIQNEKEAKETNQQESQDTQEPSSSFSSSSDDEKDHEEIEEVVHQGPASAVSLLAQQEETQKPALVLVKKQQREWEEKQRLQKKYQRLMERVENIKNTKQTKYRKIQMLIKQHVDYFGGAFRNARGSGRHIQLGRIHSGFHQPHGADIKGGALRNLLGLMEQSAVGGFKASYPQKTVP